LNEFKDNEDFYIVKGSEIVKNASKFFGSTYNNKNLPEKGTVSLKANNTQRCQARIPPQSHGAPFLCVSV